MLKGIPKELTPEMLKLLSEMGHGDTLVIADAHFPAATCGKRVIQYPCVNATNMIRAILEVFPLDDYVESPVCIMSLVPSDVEKGMPRPSMWDEVWKMSQEKEDFEVKLGEYNREAFYEEAKKAYLIIQTGEVRQYGNFILTKGIVK